MFRFYPSSALILILLASTACTDSKKESAPAQGAAPAEGTSTEQAAAPKAKEPIEPLPAKVEVDMDKVLLGRALFHDNLLSGDDSLSCATCHSLDHGGAEPRKSSQGIRGQSGPINSPTVLNSAYNFVQFWDGRAKTLEEQAEGPVENPLEMGATWDEVVKKVAAQEDYKAKFDKLYDGKIDKGTITHAIAEYERSLVTPSRFDRFLRGDASAITEAEKAGYTKFKETGCPTCHTGVLAGGTSFQKMGLVKDYFKERGGELTEADQGRFNVTKNEADRHHFKVPTLRNVELTPPYFHDGSHETLEAAVKTMARVQLGRELSDADAASIAAFLRSLTGELPAHAKVPAAG